MDRNHSCKIHGYFSSTVIKGDVPCPWCERDSYRKIVCPDNPGGRHRWNGDGQCLDCCNYATDLIDSTLPTKNTARDPDFYGPGLPKFYAPDTRCSQCGQREEYVKQHGCPDSCGRKPLLEKDTKS